MRKIVVLMHLTLDGVRQGSGRPDEDMRDGFAHGGWARPRGDAMGVVDVGLGSGAALLLGRQTYEDFYAFWPHQAENPFTTRLNTMQKYVEVHADGHLGQRQLSQTALVVAMHPMRGHLVGRAVSALGSCMEVNDSKTHQGVDDAPRPLREQTRANADEHLWRAERCRPEVTGL